MKMNLIHMRTAVVAALALMLLFAAPQVGPAQEPLTSAAAGRPIEGGDSSVDQLAASSDVILHGTLTSRTAEWVEGRIFTFYSLAVHEVVKGSVDSQVTLAVPGGVKGIVVSTWSGTPRLEIGDELVILGNSFGSNGAIIARDLYTGLLQVRTDPSSNQNVVHARGRPQAVSDLLTELRGAGN